MFCAIARTRAALRVLIAIIGIFGTALTLEAPTSAQSETPQFRSGITVTRVDVTVLDKRSRLPITGLKTEDFAIKVDGRPQRIISLVEVEAHTPPVTGRVLREVASDVATNSVASPRLFVLVLNDVGGGTSPYHRRTGQGIANRFVDALGPDDLASVIFVRDNVHAQDFTADRTLLRRAIDRYDPAWFAPDVACPMTVLRRTQTAMASIRDLRRAIIFISPVHNVLCGNVDWDVQEIQRLARFNDVPIYAFSAQGLQAPGPDELAAKHKPWRTDQHIEQLRTVAGLTGGRALVNTNNPAGLVPTVLAELRSYYVLGFEQSYPYDKRSLRIEVETTHPNAIVVSSRTVITQGELKDSRAQGREASWSRHGILEALATPLPSGDLPLQLAAAPLPSPGSDGAVLVLTLALPPVTSAERFSIALVAFDGEGRRMFLHDTREVTVPNATDGDPTEVTIRLPLRAGRYNLRLSAERLSTHSVGSVAATVTIPDFAREGLSVSGIVVGRAESRRIWGDQVKDVLPFAPTSARGFAKSDRVGMFVRINQSARITPSPVVVRTELLDDAGADIRADERTLSPQDFRDKVSAEYRFELPLQRLEPGDYLIRLTASTANHTVQRTVRFAVK